MHADADHKVASIKGSHRHQGYGIKGQWLDGRGRSWTTRLLQPL